MEPMHKHTRLAHDVREELFTSLRPICNSCGSTESLEFDCKNPKGDRHHRLSSYDRALFYRRQLQAGNLQVLCQSCNNLKGSLSWDDWMALFPF